MNTIKLTILFAALMLVALHAPAQSTITTTNFLTPQTVTGTPTVWATNYGQSVLIGNAYISTGPAVDIWQGGLTTTNSAHWQLNIGISTNQAAMSLIQDVSFPTTSSGDYVIQASSIVIPIYEQVVTITSNAVPVAIKGSFFTH